MTQEGQQKGVRYNKELIPGRIAIEKLDNPARIWFRCLRLNQGLHLKLIPAFLSLMAMHSPDSPAPTMHTLIFLES